LKVISIIPARGGSKGIKNKNLKRVGGETLIERAIGASNGSTQIVKCYVTSDSEQILNLSSLAGATPIERPLDLSTDESPTETALLHALEQIKAVSELPELTVLIQCTSPFISPTDLDLAIQFLIDHPEYNSAFSVVRTHSFLWKQNDLELMGINHTGVKRLRRQECETQFLETGAFYIFRTSKFLESGSRFNQPMHPFEVSQLSSIEIDSDEDLAIAKIISPHVGNQKLKFWPKVVVTDFDGVHTNDKVMIDESGKESVLVSRSDGFGVGLLKKMGITVLILSSERNKVVTARANKLGIECIQSSESKAADLEVWLSKHGFNFSDVLYLGNDLNDLDVMKRVGFSVAVKNANPEVLIQADFILDSCGGENAVREMTELVKQNLGMKWSQK